MISTKNKYILYALSTFFIAIFSHELSAKTIVTDVGTLVSQDQITLFDCGNRMGTVVVLTGCKVAVVNSEAELELEGINEKEDVISLRYFGTKAEECHWIQFAIYRVIIRLADGTNQFVNTKIKTTSGEVCSTQTNDFSDVNWHIDSISPSSPSYEHGGGVAIHNQGESSIFDKPGPPLGFVKGITNDPNIVAVGAFADYESYLVCDKKLCYKVAWQVAQYWTRENGETEPETRLVSTQKKPSLRDKQKSAIQSKYWMGQNIIDLN